MCSSNRGWLSVQVIKWFEQSVCSLDQVQIKVIMFSRIIHRKPGDWGIKIPLIISELDFLSAWGAYLQHPKTFHPRALILSFLSLHFILTNSSLHFHPLNFIFTNSSPTFYPTPCNPFQIIYYISYPTNSSSSKWDLLFHTFNLIHTISSSSIHSLNFISLI